MLLIHGQLTDWRSWSRVLPRLAERYHVFAVDCYGHGKSARVPGKYSARAMAADMVTFLERVAGEPATIAGHSSGGLIAAGAGHPGEPVKIFCMPPSLSELFRAMGTYDPRFGDTFCTGPFDEGSGHAGTLSRITVPVARIHVKPRYDDSGILHGPLSCLEAPAAVSGWCARPVRCLLRSVRVRPGRWPNYLVTLLFPGDAGARAC